MSNLVFIVDKRLSNNNKFSFEDGKNQVIYSKEWYKKDTDFYKNFVVQPNEYYILIPGPIRSVSINTMPGEVTYLRIGPYLLDDTIKGIQVTSWTGEPGKAVTQTIEYLKSRGLEDDILPTKLNVTGNVIRLSPDSPWPIPPPPPPK